METVEKYRNSGIVTAIAYRFVQYCLENDLKPQWEAMSYTKYSVQIAKKIGFEFDYEYKLYEIEIDKKETETS
ncbi:MAG: GNAT family N-acetyltransferase [Spirochaetaceae bacterium]|nr:GNAT family N-acetyltransferase [Spirochaetaceae bacterium]